MFKAKNINNRNKRFIAGASCPNCGDLDSLVLDSVDQSIACVSCNYTQTAAQRDKTPQKTKEIGDIKITRVE
ncbi:MAG: YheV family putative metal-binding protein [Kangiellaceae bacterium]